MGGMLTFIELATYVMRDHWTCSLRDAGSNRWKKHNCSISRWKCGLGNNGCRKGLWSWSCFPPKKTIHTQNCSKKEYKPLSGRHSNYRQGMAVPQKWLMATTCQCDFKSRWTHHDVRWHQINGTSLGLETKSWPCDASSLVGRTEATFETLMKKCCEMPLRSSLEEV